MGLLDQRPSEYTAKGFECGGRLKTKVNWTQVILGMVPYLGDGHDLHFRSEMFELETDVWEDEGVSLDLSPNQF